MRACPDAGGFFENNGVDRESRETSRPHQVPGYLCSRTAGFFYEAGLAAINDVSQACSPGFLHKRHNRVCPISIYILLITIVINLTGDPVAVFEGESPE
jgi:hypothetical protein